MNVKNVVLLLVLAVILVFGSYTFYLREELKDITHKRVTHDMCEEFTANCKNIKELTLFEKDSNNLKSLSITASRDAIDKFIWQANVVIVDRKGFETNNFFKEFEFFTLIKKVEALVYKGVRQ